MTISSNQSLSKHAHLFNLDRTITIPNWEDVTNVLQLPSDSIVDLGKHAENPHPLARFNGESFGHQDTKHIGGVPGRIGGCTATIRYALKGKVSHQLLSWRGLVIVHDNQYELEWLIVGEFRLITLPKNVDPEDTVWIKDHPDFQSVEWPLDREEFKESRY
jgi:hypothetical protein